MPAHARSHRSARVHVVVAAGACLAAIIGLVSCGPDFVPASVIQNERVIGIVADPPESVPGGSVSLTPVVVSPRGTLAVDVDYGAHWFRCPDSDSTALEDTVPCSDPGARIEVGRSAPYVDSVPADLFGAPPDPENPPPDVEALGSDKLLGAILGYWRVTSLEMTITDSGEVVRDVDAFKRVPIYLPVRLDAIDARLADLDTRINAAGELEPNTNPTLSAVLVHEGSADGATTTTIKPGKQYFFEPVIDDRSLQAYFSLKVDLAGLDLSDPDSIKDVPLDDLLARFEKVQRCEIPVFSWFVTHGRMRRDTTLDEDVLARVYDPRGVPCPPVEGEPREPFGLYTPPVGDDVDPKPADGVVHAWVVLRDGRGGTAVRAFDLTLE